MTISSISTKIKNNSVTALLVLIFVTLGIKENFNSLMLILALAYALFHKPLKDFNIGQLWRDYWPVILYFMICTLSLAFSESLKDVEKFGLRNLPFLILPIIAYRLNITKEQVRNIIWLFCIWMLIMGAFSHAKIISQLFADGEAIRNLFRKDYSYQALADTVGLHPTYYAYYMVVCCIYLIHSLLFVRPLKYLWLRIGMLMYFLFFIVHLSSRMSIVVVLLLSFWMVLIYFRRREQLGRGLLYLVLASMVIATTLYNVRATRYRFQQIIGLTFANGTRHDDGLNKLKQFKAVFEANSNFVWGSGIANADPAIFEAYRNNDLLDFADRRYNGHNQYLQNYVGMGIIGLAVLVVLLGYYYLFFYRKKNLFGLAIVMAFSMFFITESVWVRHNGIVLALLCLLILYRAERSLEDSPVTKG